MVIVDSSSYKNFLKSISKNDIFVNYVLKKHGVHPANNDPLVIFIKHIIDGETYVINLDHGDMNKIGVDPIRVIDLIIQTANRVFVLDKKRFLNLFKNKNVYDLLIFEFQSGYSQSSDLDFSTSYHDFIKFKVDVNFEGLNFVIPMSKHIESFEITYEHFKETISEFEDDFSYNQINGIITETLSEVELHGIHVDESLFNKYFEDKHIKVTGSTVYTEYNIFTSTGRPSNRFGKVNYAALNKDDGCRKSFTSRFGSDGMLLSIDYSAYHPHIIANLINYKIDITLNIYEYLGKHYFNREILSEDDIKKAKNLTFQNFYGGIREEFKNIDYFNKISQYIEHRWNFFNENGYVETPVFKRRITTDHISDPNPNKLFNYLLQAAETEFSIQNINRVNESLRIKKSKVVLYTYDSILVDVCKDDGRETLLDIKSLMIDNQFPVKCHVGKNYDELYEIDLK